MNDTLFHLNFYFLNQMMIITINTIIIYIQISSTVLVMSFIVRLFPSFHNPNKAHTLHLMTPRPFPFSDIDF
jgi:hypothetical protein